MSEAAVEPGGVSDAALIAHAHGLINRRHLSPTVEVASVGAALVTPSGAVYGGVNIDTSCSLGFCAEHSAIAAMIAAGESRIVTIVAVSERTGGGVVPPCGRCRELIWQVDPANHATRVLMGAGEAVLLQSLLPRHWRADWG
ncbi:MAG: cytidine deaminase [Pseudomonadota bacterium]